MNIVHVRCSFYVGAADQEPNERTSTKQRLWCSPRVRVPHPQVSKSPHAAGLRVPRNSLRVRAFVCMCHTLLSRRVEAASVCFITWPTSLPIWPPALHSRPAAHELGGHCRARC